MDTDPQVTELLLRWQELRQQGQVVTAAELCADCPELAGELQRCMETVDHWEQFLDTCDEGEAPSTVPESFGKYRRQLAEPALVDEARTDKIANICTILVAIRQQFHVDQGLKCDDTKAGGVVNRRQ